jgi:uncharacterized protein
MLPALLLAAALGLLYRLARGDVRAFARFTAIGESARRRRTLLRWTATSFAAFGLVPLAGLALLGRLDTLGAIPVEFAPLVAAAPPLPPLFGDFGLALLAAMLVGGVVGGLRAGRRRGDGIAPHLAPMIPRNAAEALCVALLAGNAAVVEELFFRLYLPLLLAALGLGPFAACALATALFGCMHRYQGWIGMVLTALLGAGFAFLYCAGASLAYPVAAHLLLNASALLLRPLVAALRND